MEIAQQMMNLAVSCITLTTLARALVLAWRADRGVRQKEIDRMCTPDAGADDEVLRGGPAGDPGSPSEGTS